MLFQIKKIFYVVTIYFCLSAWVTAQENSTNGKNFQIKIFSEKLQALVARPLYDLDTEELPTQLRPIFKDNPEVKSVIIIENIEQEVVLSFYRNARDELIFNPGIPDTPNTTHQQEKVIVTYNQTEVGKILIYYKEPIPSIGSNSSQNIGFSPKEQAWLDKKIPIRYVYDPDWAPFEWTNSVGKHAGIISDILKLIKAKTGITLIPINTKTWAESTEYAKNRRADMFSASGVTEERQTYMQFSEQNIFSTHYVFVSRHGEDYLEGFKDLNNKKLAVVKEYTIHKLLKKSRPDFPFVLLDSIQEGFDKLLNQEIDVFLVNTATAKYFSRQAQYKSLKLAYQTEYQLNLKVAIRNDWPPEVLAIFNKAINSISEEELADIYDKWTEVKITKEIDYTLLYQVAAFLLFLILMVIFWNRKLNALVQAKTHDIEAQKIELEYLSKNLEEKVIERTQELDAAMTDLKSQRDIAIMAKKRQNELFTEVEAQKEFTTRLLDSQEQIVLTTNGNAIQTCNQAFLNFFKIQTLADFTQQYPCICDRFNPDAPDGYIKKETDGLPWIDYIIQNQHQIHKVMLSDENQDYIFSVTGATLPAGKHLKSAVFTDITELEQAKQQVEEIHKRTQESIEYAALIQGSLIPNEQAFSQYFDDHFTLWEPKDIVGGDIYLVEEINPNEWILMVIDCTGHGVPGAFVTMLVKALERQIIANIHRQHSVSPAKMLSVFNRSIKQLLKQEQVHTISNAGFDGGILYYNQQQKQIRFAGAEIPLFLYQNHELKIIKGNRHSIGYKKSDPDYEFTEHTIDVSIPTQIYLSSDGYFDQNGGNKGFPFGKKRFQNILCNIAERSFSEQKAALLEELHDYQQDNKRNDDITVIGMKIE